MNTAVSRASLGEEHQNLAKLFCMGPGNDWEEVFVGICSVLQRVSVFSNLFVIVLTNYRKVENGNS